MELEFSQGIYVNERKNKLRLRIELFASEGDKTYSSHRYIVPLIPVPAGIASMIKYSMNADTTEYFNKYQEWLSSLSPSEYEVRQRPTITRFLTVPEKFSLDEVKEFLLSVYDPDTWVTLDDVISRPDHARLVTALMKDKPLYCSSTIKTRDLMDLIESTKLKLPKERFIVSTAGGRVVDIKEGTITVGTPDPAGGNTYYCITVNPINTATGTGTLTYMSVRLTGTTNGVYIGTAYNDPDSSHQTSRDYLNLGTVSGAGLHEYSDVDVDVSSGDYAFNSFTISGQGITRQDYAGGCRYNDSTTVPFTQLATSAYNVRYATYGEGALGGSYDVSTSDGVKGGESTVKGSLSVGVIATDALKGSESNDRAYNAKPVSIDGVKLSEARLIGLLKLAAAVDGLKLSESLMAGLAKFVIASDGLKGKDGDYQTIYGSPQTLTLRPNAAGDLTECTPYGDTYNYQCVDEASADDDTTYVYHAIGESHEWFDFYNLPACGLSGVVIDSVKIYSRCRSTYTTPNGASYNPIRIKTHGTEYDPYGSPSWSVSYVTYDYTYTTNPYTGAAWTTSEIDDLQIGVGLWSNTYNGYARCTQMYVEVNYRTVTTGYYPVTIIGKGAVASDGFKLGESNAFICVKYVSSTDGMKLGDVLSYLKYFNPTVNEGIKLSESMVTKLIRYIVVLEGIKSSDTPLKGSELSALVSDGLKLSESAFYTWGFNIVVNDELKISEIILTQQLAHLLAQDGIKLSDLVSFPGVALLIEFILTKYRDVQPIVTHNRELEVISTLYRLLESIITGG